MFGDRYLKYMNTQKGFNLTEIHIHNSEYFRILEMKRVTKMQSTD